jgi:hypothetical protein
MKGYIERTDESAQQSSKRFDLKEEMSNIALMKSAMQLPGFLLFCLLCQLLAKERVECPLALTKRSWIIY